MRAVDTDVLVQALREEMPHHRKALAVLRRIATDGEPWALPWPCVYEFLRVVTHPRVFDPPTPNDVALADVATLLASPSVIVLGEGPSHAGWMRTVLTESRATGNQVFDAHIAALLPEHGASEILTGDADFHRFRGLRVVNPFSDQGARATFSRQGSGRNATRRCHAIPPPRRGPRMLRDRTRRATPTAPEAAAAANHASIGQGPPARTAPRTASPRRKGKPQ